MSRRQFAPTEDHRRNVEAMVGFGIPQDEICHLIINPETRKAIDEKTLRKHFAGEIATGNVKAKRSVCNFVMNTILGRTQEVTELGADGTAIVRRVPLGLVDERARATLTVLYMRTRVGWKETTAVEHTGKDGGPIQQHVWHYYPEDDSL